MEIQYLSAYPKQEQDDFRRGIAACDDTERMDIDLPGDSAASTREKTLLQDVQQKLADIKIQCCSCCERGSDIKVPSETNEYQRYMLINTGMESNANKVSLFREV